MDKKLDLGYDTASGCIMINIGIRYFNKDGSSGVVLAGDTAVSDPTTGSLIIEGSSFMEISEFPVVFAPIAMGNSAIISDFTNKLDECVEKQECDNIDEILELKILEKNKTSEISFHKWFCELDKSMENFIELFCDEVEKH
ncbi:MAG: hypothetical protein ACUVQ9_13275 [Thermodesulfobacteriota bacterium]